MEHALVNLKRDRPLLQNLSGLINIRSGSLHGFREDWSCRLEVDTAGFRVVVDWLLDREKMVAFPQYHLLEDLVCIVVTTPDDDPSDLAMMLQLLQEERPRKSQIHWLHIQSGEGLKQANLLELFSDFDEVSRHIVDHETDSERIHFDHKEWATLILMLVERLMISDKGAVDFDRQLVDFTYGVASIDFSQSDGRRILKAKSYLDVLHRENARTHLDDIYRLCNKALNGAEKTFGEILHAVGQPSDIEDYLQRHNSFDAFDAHALMSEFRQKLYADGGVVDKVNSEVENRLIHLAQQIRQVILDDCDTVQVKLTVLQCLLGQSNSRVIGKPMNPVITVDDCDQPAFDALHGLGIEGVVMDEGLGLGSMKRLRRLCAELHDDLMSLTQEVADAQEFGVDSRGFEEEKKSVEHKWREAEENFGNHRLDFHRLRWENISQLSSNWLEERASRIIEESEHIPPEVAEAEPPGLTNKEWAYVAASMIGLTSWAIEFWNHYPAGLVGVLLWCLAASFWTWFILKRYRKPEIHVPDPLIAQRDLWRKKALELYQMSLHFAMIQRYQRRFDELIRVPLQREASRIEEVMERFRNHEPKAVDVIESSFIPVQCVEQLGNRQSFLRYHHQVIAPNILHRKADLYRLVRAHQGSDRKWDADEVLEDYLVKLGEDVEAKLEELDGFHMLQYLLNEVESGQAASFLRDDCPDFEEIIRRVRIRLEPLHSGTPTDNHIAVLYDGGADQELVDRLKDKLNEVFEESKSNSLDFIPTDDPNRLSFVRVSRIESKNAKAQHSQYLKRSIQNGRKS